MLIETKKEGLSQYRLMLLSDANVPYCFAKAAVKSIMRCSEENAKLLTKAAHKKGSSVLCETNKERAEFLSSQFAAYPIPITTIFCKMWQESA